MRDYAKPWSEIVGKNAREIFAVDACAGAGAYTDPDSGETISEGSPVIFARRAALYTAEHGPGRTMRVICIERDHENCAALTERLAPFAPHVITRRGAFRTYVPEIIETIGDAPALVLLDPIGLKTITASHWEPLLNRKGKTDLFIVLHFAVVHRTGGMLLPDGTHNPTKPTARRTALMLDGVFRGPEWRAIAIDPALRGDHHREERERLYVRLYLDQVIGGSLRWKCWFRVRARFSSPVVYWLIQAADDLKPYMLMNDQAVKLKDILFRREYGAEGQLENFVDLQVEARHKKAGEELTAATIECLAGAMGHALPFGAIRDQLVNRFFGRVKQGAYSNVVKALAKEGRVTREDRLAAKLTDAEIITLVEPPAEGATGAVVVPIRPAA